MTVRVSLGLKPRYEKSLYWEPKKRVSSGGANWPAWTEDVIPVPAPEGVYVYDGNGVDHVRLFDHEGNYVRTVYPPPAGRLKEFIGLKTRKFPQDGLELPLKTDSRVWFNEDLESRNFIVPGLIAIIMTMVGALLTALCIIREKERGSMEGLMGTPLKKWELILWKLGPYFLVGMLDMFIAMIMGEFLFQVPLRGSALLFIGLAALFMVVVLGQGLLISVIARSQLDAYQMAMLTTFLPSFILSGAMFAIHQMPTALQAASYLVPATCLVTISKGIYLKGVGMKILWPEALMLCGFAAFFLLTAGRKLVKKIQ